MYLTDESKSSFEKYYEGSGKDIKSSYKEWEVNYFFEQYNQARNAISWGELIPSYRAQVSFFAQVNGMENLEDALKQWQQYEQTKENVQYFTKSRNDLDQYKRLSLNAVLPQYMQNHALSDVEAAYNSYEQNPDKPSDKDVQDANATLELIQSESKQLTDEERELTDFKRLQWIFARETLVQELANIRPPTALSESLIKGLIEIIERNTDILNENWRYSKTVSEVKKAIKVLDMVNPVPIAESLALNSFLPDSIDPDVIARIVERDYGYDSEMKYNPIYSAVAVRYRDVTNRLILNDIHKDVLFRNRNMPQ